MGGSNLHPDLLNPSVMLKQILLLLIDVTIAIVVTAQQTPPVKDIKRLQLLPSQPPTRAELVSSLQQSVRQIQKGMPVPKLEAINQLTATQPVEIIHEKAILEFYANDPKGAILMMMQMAAKAQDSLLLLNNLGAMLNMHGAEHKAVPLLQYCLQKLPNSSIVLNNIGQSFMGLGDLFRAADYFNQCLSIDSLNIEANHSMGMLHYFKKEYDAAMTYFEREMSVAMRRTTLAMAYKMGKKFNLRAIMQRKQRRSGRPQKDHFEEITLGKFSFPNLPQTARQIINDKKTFAAYATSVRAEFMTWTGYANQIATGYTAQTGNQLPGVYSDLATAMLEELQEEFSPEYLNGFTASDHQHIMDIISHNINILVQLKCPEAPAGTGIDAQEAYEIKCCRELKEPMADKMVKEISSYVQPIIRTGEGRWKAYINQLVEIVQLDPSPGNQAMVYHAVAGYFNYMSLGAVYFSAGEVNNLIPKCFEAYSDSELDSLMESDRDWRITCPAWLNLEVDFDGMALKVDCDKYVIEAGSSIMGGFEHEFKSGKSTLLLGPATKAEFLGLTAELKTQLFITFDGNKQFADFGVKNTGELGLTGTPISAIPHIKIGGNLAGIEVSTTMGIISGYIESLEKKGIIALF
jgi:tetratricopeptide (TPR) repeat protein